MSGLTEDAASSLATDDVRAVGARRLASALRSQPISIHFRTADGAMVTMRSQKVDQMVINMVHWK